jgi:hypothetical protein
VQVVFTQKIAVAITGILIGWSILLMTKIFIMSGRFGDISYNKTIAVFIFCMLLTTAIRLFDFRVLNKIGWNILMVYHTIMCFLLFYGSHIESDFKKIKEEMFVLLKIFVYLPTFLSVLGVFIAIFSNQINMKNQAIGIKSHRLVGVYSNSNVLGFFCVLSIISSLILIRERKKMLKTHKTPTAWFLIVCIFFNSISLFLSDSNGALLFLIIYFISMFFCGIIRNNKTKKSKLKLIFLLLLCVTLVFVSLAVRGTIQNAFNITVKLLHFRNFSTTSAIEIGRGNYEITSGRNILLQQGFKLFKKFPVLGVGAKNLTEYAKIYLTDKLDCEDLHNGYLTILVSWGGMGFTVFAFFTCLMIICLCRTLFNRRDKNDYKIYSNIFSLVVAYAVYSLVEVTLLSSVSFRCAFFWTILGYAMCYVNEMDECSNGVVEKRNGMTIQWKRAVKLKSANVKRSQKAAKYLKS